MARLLKKTGVRKCSASVGLSVEALGHINVRFLSTIGCWISDLFVLSSVCPLPSFLHREELMTELVYKSLYLNWS